MKKIITLIVLVFLCHGIKAQPQWGIVPLPSVATAPNHSPFLNVIDSLTVVITPRYTYYNQYILKTTDGGQTWNPYEIDSTMYTILHEVEFVDANTGYISGGTAYGNWNIFLKTINGGQTWQNVNTSFLGNASLSINEVSFVTDEIGFIARNNENKIFRTTNGGTSFTMLNLPQIQNGFSSFINEVKFTSPYIGFVSRILTSDYINSTNEILKTTDGGTTWNIVNTANFQNINVWEKKDKIQFVNNLQGFAIVGTGVLKTTQDGGNSWQDHNLPLNNPAATDLDFVNNATGYIALNGTIYRTDDAGLSWNLQSIENNLNHIDQVQFATENFGYAFDFVPNTSTSTNLAAPTLLSTNQQPAATLSAKLFKEDDLFTIFPNPAHDVINIQSTNNTTIRLIHLMDTSGKIIKTFKNNLNRVDVSTVSAGNYLLYIQTDHQKTVKKVIIK